MRQTGGQTTDCVCAPGIDAGPALGARLDLAVERARDNLAGQQREDGHLCAQLEADITLESDLIIALHFLGRARIHADLMAKAAREILAQQLPGGGFSTFPGGPPDVSATVKAYFALKLAGYPADAEPLARARAAIAALGGITRCNTYTRFYLALFGQYDWKGVPEILPEIMLLLPWFPLSLYSMSSWTRAIIVPLMIVNHYRPLAPTPEGGGIDELRGDRRAERTLYVESRNGTSPWKRVFVSLDPLLKLWSRRPIAAVRGRALRKARSWILRRQHRSDGLGAIWPGIVNTAFALKCLGLRDGDPVLERTIGQMLGLVIEDGGRLKVQPCKSPVWDTALTMIGWLRAGMPAGDPALARAAKWLLDELGPALNAAPWIRRAVWGFDTLAVSPKAIRVADLDESKPSDEFRELLVDVKDAPLLLSSPVPEAFIAQVAARMQAEEESGTDAETIKDLRSFAGVLDAFTASVRNEGDEPTDIGRLILERERESGLWQYLVTDNNRMYFIRITPELDTSQINALAPAIASARSVMAKVLARHPKVDAGLTGIDVVEADETEAATRDGIVASLLAATLIMLLMLSAFQSVRMPLMLMAALLAGIAWTFGFTTLAVGHLQVISVVFVPILLGLGIAYGIYLALRYERIRHTYRDDMEGCVAAMRDTYRVMGPGVLTGCLTTAAAFMMTLTTDFTGVAEMGLISGVGVILCLISMVTVFPALLRFVKPWHRHIVPVGRRFVRYYDDRWFMPFVRHPALTLGTGAVLTALSVLAAAGLQFDYNLLKLQPAGMPSVDWERRIVDDAGESIWFGVSIVGDMEEARERAERFRRLSTVSVVRGVGLLMPDDEERKIELLQELRPAGSG